MHLKSRDGFRHEYVKIYLEVRLDDHNTCTIVMVINCNPGEYLPEESVRTMPGAAGVSGETGTSSGGGQLSGETMSHRNTKSTLKLKSSLISSLASSVMYYYY